MKRGFKGLVLLLAVAVMVSLAGCSGKTPTFSLTVNYEGDGAVLVSPSKSTFTNGEKVTISAVAGPNHSFSHFEVNGSSNGANPVSFEMRKNTTVKAVFKADPVDPGNLVVNVQGEGRVLKSPEKEAYNIGDIVTLTAVAGSGSWYFDHWEGDLAGNETEMVINLDAKKTVTAVFGTTNLLLSVNVQGEGTVSRSPEKTAYNHGETVTLKAIPKVGWKFDHWEGDLEGIKAEETITINTNKKVTAVFVKELYTINITVDGIGDVLVSPRKDGYLYGDTVTLKVGSPSEWYFDHWEGDLAGTKATETIVMDSNKNITAVFKENGSIAGNIVIDGEGVIVLVKTEAPGNYDRPKTHFFHSSSDFNFDNITPGDYLLAVKSGNYISSYKNVTVNAGRVTMVNDIKLTEKKTENRDSFTYWANETSKTVDLSHIPYQRVNYTIGLGDVEVYRNGSLVTKAKSRTTTTHENMAISPGVYTAKTTNSKGMFIMSYYTSFPSCFIDVSVPWSYGATSTRLTTNYNWRIEYRLSTSPHYSTGTWKSVSNGETVNITSKGIWYLHVKGVDDAGNSFYKVEGPYIIS